MKVTDGVFGPLARRLTALDVQRTYKRAMAEAADEGREELRIELDAAGAPRSVRDAIHVLREPAASLTASVGVDWRDKEAAQAALDWEYGSADHTVAPHATFRMISEDMADHASALAAQEFARQVVG